MKCTHDWKPLVQIDTSAMTRETQIGVAFSFSLARLNRYDRCAKCGRLSYIRNSRARGRSLLSIDTTSIETRAAEFLAWAEEQVRKQ